MWTIVFTSDFYDELVEFLFSTKSENGCFLLAKSYQNGDENTMIILEVLKPQNDSWNKKGAHSLEPSSSFINQCVVAADVKNASLIFVHTHPHSMHPSGFSWIDEKSNQQIFTNLSQILPDIPLGSLVFSRKGICGVTYSEEKIESVSKIKIVGKRLEIFPGVGFEKEANEVSEKYDRQVRMIGKKNQSLIGELKIAIVGVGGTGSPLAVQLSRIGAKQLSLIDLDKIDETNIPRVYGSIESDIGKPKTEVMKNHIQSYSDCKIDTHNIDITKEDLSFLLDSDIIFSCTDNLTSRSVLNEISNQYCIPLIDVGCRIHLNEDEIHQAIVKVQIVTPDHACLWCTGTLDGRIIMQESLPEDEKEGLREEGYLDEVEKQPSIISMTTMGASMAVNKLLSLLGVFGENYSSKSQIEIKDGFMIEENPEIKSDCICRKNLGKAEKYSKITPKKSFATGTS